MAALAIAGVMVAGAATGVTAQGVTVDPAIAGMTPEQLVEARQAAMKQNGGIMRGAAGLSGAEAVAAADTLLQNFTNFPALFAEGSIVGDSRATPLIWQEKAAFDAIFGQAAGFATEMKVAAESGDMAAFGAAAQQIGPLCGMCHDKYRAPQ